MFAHEKKKKKTHTYYIECCPSSQAGFLNEPGPEIRLDADNDPFPTYVRTFVSSGDVVGDCTGLWFLACDVGAVCLSAGEDT